MSPARNTFAVSTVALLTSLALAGCDQGTAAESQSPDPTEPSDTVTSAGTDAWPRSMQGVDGALEAGAWSVPLYAEDYVSLPRAVVDVPEGYGSPGGWTVDRGADGDSENYGAVDFWVVDTVQSDPCHGDEGVDPGPTVRDLADALHGQSGHRATAPEPVTLDGHSGLYLEVIAPSRKKLATCSAGAFTLWHSDGGMPNATNVPGTVFQIWILDVDGTRIAINETTTPHETKADKAEVRAIAESTHFVDATAPTS